MLDTYGQIASLPLGNLFEVLGGKSYFELLFYLGYNHPAIQKVFQDPKNLVSFNKKS